MGWPVSVVPATQCSSICISSCYFKKGSLPAFSSTHLAISNQRASSDFEASVITQRSNISCSRSLIAEKNKKSRRICAGQLKVEDVAEDDEACELVNGAELLIGEGDDEISAYLYKAVKNNNGAGILLLSDVYGFQDSATTDFAYRVACNGYNVLVPDIFRGDPWAKDRPQALFEEWYDAQSAERVEKDIFASANWMVNEFLDAGISKKLGIIGFCYGGGQVINILAQDQGGCFGTGVSFYGTRIDTSVAANVKVPALLISGDKDPLCSIHTLKEIEKKIEQSKVVVFEERGHGFVHRPESPEEDEDAEKAFVVMRNWLHEGLGIET